MENSRTELDRKFSSEDLLRLDLVKELVKESTSLGEPIFLRSFLGQRGCILAVAWTPKGGRKRIASAVIISVWTDESLSYTITKATHDPDEAEEYATSLAWFSQCQEVNDEGSH